MQDDSAFFGHVARSYTDTAASLFSLSLCCAARDGHRLQARAAGDAEVVYADIVLHHSPNYAPTLHGFYVTRRYCVSKRLYLS